MPLDPPGRVVVLGAGPTGLGAARRLQELGHPDWDLFERAPTAGGLAASFTDEHGFTWDLGAHVQFSHYDYFDDLMQELLAGEWLVHQRSAWIYQDGSYVPYPFQANLHRLPEALREECLRGLTEAQAQRAHGPTPANFEDWILSRLGAGIAAAFMLPYNRKVWAHPPSAMSYSWLGERVPEVDVAQVRAAIEQGEDDSSWGPNATFQYPASGGTGEIWRRLATTLPPAQLHYDAEVVTIDADKKRLHFGDGSTTEYDALVTTAPLDWTVQAAGLTALEAAAAALRHSTVHVIGVALSGQPPPQLAGKTWIYSAGDEAPWYRANLFASFSPANVPDPNEYWSILVEVSESEHRAVNPETIESEVVTSLVRLGMISSPERVHHLWRRRLAHGYPTPSLGRDEALATLLPALEAQAIFSRGRFGAWKYEVSNQDHSLMQGVEVIDRLLRGTPEITVSNPDVVNGTPRTR